MSVHFISGKPGGGKSLYAVRLVVDHLVRTNMVVITNLSLKPGELNAYLQEKYPEVNIDLHARLRILNEDEAGQFWLYRPPRRVVDEHGERWEWVELRPLTKDEEKAGQRMDFTPTNGLPGVLYVIDELHLFFNARAWMDTGKSCLFYLSQHRKVSDHVVCVTQSINNVDKQFRSVAQDFTYLMNLRKTKLLKIFKLPGMFTWQTYLQPVTGTPGESSMEMGTFRLDVEGLAACYDTAAGVGIRGTTADTTERVRGLPWWLLAGLPVVAMIAVWFMPDFFSGVTNAATRQRGPAMTTAKAGSGPQPGPNVSTNATGPGAGFRVVGQVGPSPGPAPVPAGPPATVTGTVRTAPQEEVWLTGVGEDRGLVTVWLSDGRTYTNRDRELTFIGRNFVVIDQVVYRFANPKALNAGAR